MADIQKSAAKPAGQPPAAAEETPEQQLPPGVRTVAQDRVMARMKARAGEHAQEVAVLEVLLEDAEGERDQLRGQVAALRTELVAATSARTSPSS